ncbi:MAG: papain-like cysteine protease family protein [Anaerolineales bacterium]
MKFIRALTVAALFAALFVLVLPAQADCGDGDPTCLLEPPISVEIRTDSSSGDASVTASESGALTPLDFAVPMPLPRRVEAPLVSAPSELESTDSVPDFANLSIPMRYQAAGDVSCGVQALGMALDGIDGSAPTSNSLLGFLQDQDMMYDFGTGVEELAHAAQNFGYAGSLPFHGWSLDQLSATLAEGKPVVVALGANGDGEPGHFVTVTGVSSDGRWVTYNDPTLGKQVIPVEEFNRLWGLQGSSGVFVDKSLPVGEPADYAPWVALAAGLMALVSTTPLALQRKGIGGVLVTHGGGSNASSPPYAAPAGKRWAKKTVTKYDWKDITFTEKVEVPNIVRTWAIVRVNRWIEKVPVYKTVTVDRGRWAYRTVKKYRTERYRTSQRYRVKKSYWYRRNGRFYRGTRYVWKTRTVVKTRRVPYTKRERYWVPKIVQEQRFVRNREIEHRDPVYGWRDEKHGTKMASVTKTVPKWMPVGKEEKWELENLPVTPKPDPDYSYEMELFQNRTENYLSQQAQLQASIAASSTPTPIVTQTPPPPLPNNSIYGTRVPEGWTPTPTLTPEPTGTPSAEEILQAQLERDRCEYLDCITLEQGTFIGDNPFKVDDSLGTEPSFPGIPGIIMGFIELFNTFAGPEAYGRYLENQEDNVVAQLTYSQDTAGKTIESVGIHNESNQSLKIVVSVQNSNGTITQIGPEWVTPGQSTIDIYRTIVNEHESEDPLLITEDSTGSVEVTVIAQFNDPLILRSIEFTIPSED